MNLYSKMLLTSAILLVASSSIAQERYHPPDPNLLARFSYDNSGVVRQGDVHHVCLAVSREGDYRIVRSLDNGQTQRATWQDAEGRITPASQPAGSG